MKKQVPFLFVVFLLFTNMAFCQLNTGTVYVPTTISEEARDILNGWTIEGRNSGAHVPKADAPIAEWAKIQQKYAMAAAEHVPTVIESYGAKVDTVFLDGIRVISVKPKNYQKSNKVIIYIHGGAFAFYPADVTLVSCVPLADATGLRIITIDYTLAPQAKFNQISNEIVKAYCELLKEYKPKNIAIYGDSAGGAIAASSILKMRDQNMKLPGVLVLWSPWTDVDEVGDTYKTLKDNDPNLVYNDFLGNCAEAYAPKSEWKNPYVSPVYGDYSKDFPPTLIQVGGKEIFLSNSIRMYRNLKENNKEVELDIYEGMWHVWQGYYNVPESKMAIKNTKNFIFKHLKINK